MTVNVIATACNPVPPIATIAAKHNRFIVQHTWLWIFNGETADSALLLSNCATEAVFPCHVQLFLLHLYIYFNSMVFYHSIFCILKRVSFKKIPLFLHG